MLSVFAAALLMAAADPAPPAAAPPSAAAPAAVAQPPAKPKAEKKVCWMETPTGSHFSKQVCATQDELDQMQHNAQDALSDHARPPPPKFGPGD